MDSETARMRGQVCDRCRRRKIKCHGEDDQCSNCVSAGIICVVSAKLKRNRKRKSFYEAEGIETRRPSTPPMAASTQDGSSSLLSESRPTPVMAASYISDTAANASTSVTDKRLMAPTSAQVRQPVIGHMGRLVSNHDSVAMFCGSSTGVHFISQAEQQLQMMRLHTETFPSCTYSLHLHGLWGTSPQSSALELVRRMVAGLPPDAQRTIATTIDVWTPLYPILHKNSTVESYQSLTNAETPPGLDIVILYQILGILALGTLGQPGGLCSASHQHFLCGSDIYYHMSTSLLDKVLEKPCLQTLQGLQVMQIYLQLSSRHSMASHIGGVAVRLAQSLGLHRHSHRFRFDPLETEMRRRVWWCQYTLDTFSSTYHGMPRLIRDQDADTDLPTRIDHDLLSRSHAAFPLPGERSQVDTALSLVKLARIMGESLENLYTTTKRRGGVPKIARLQADLDAWERDSLPRESSVPADSDLGPSTGRESPTNDGEDSQAKSSFYIMFLRTALCIVTIHAHRPALAFTAADPQFPLSLEACIHASAKLIRLLSHHIPGEEGAPSVSHDALLATTLYPNGIHMLWQAGLTILFARCKGTYVATAEEDDRTVAHCSVMLRSFEKETSSPDLSTCAEVLDSLRQRIFGVTQTSTVPDQQVQWNVWDWPMDSALELVNILDAAPLDLYVEPEAWL